MANSAEYNYNCRVADLIEFTAEELVQRFHSGASMSYRQFLDALLIVESEQRKAGTLARDFRAELRSAAYASDWSAHERIWNEYKAHQEEQRLLWRGRRNFEAELQQARDAGDWDAHARLWDEREYRNTELQIMRLNSIPSDEE